MATSQSTETPKTDRPELPKPVPVAIQRLLDEVRSPTPAAYDRRHNRHNRS